MRAERCCACLQFHRDFVPKGTGMIRLKDGPYDPASVHLFSPAVFAGYWAGFRESLIADGTLARKDKEVLASFISLANECKFCTHSHLLFAEAQGACKFCRTVQRMLN